MLSRVATSCSQPHGGTAAVSADSQPRADDFLGKTPLYGNIACARDPCVKNGSHGGPCQSCPHNPRNGSVSKKLLVVGFWSFGMTLVRIVKGGL